jgi:hypothetical protein
MENRSTATSSPPRMMNAIIAGFNAATNHLILLLPPIVIDILLWLGPQVSIKKAFTPLLDDSIQLLQQVNSPELASQMKIVSDTWDQILANFNLAGFLQTFPIGVPSLMASVRSEATPLGPSRVVEVPNMAAALGTWIVLLGLGFIVGSLYFCMLAQVTSEASRHFDLKMFATKTFLSIALTLGLFLGLILLAVPVLLLTSIVTIFSPALGNAAILIAGFILIWILLPMVFTPHALFTLKTGLAAAVMTSVRLVRHYLPGTGIFLMLALVIMKGMDVLWRVPPASSWMTLVGILGHSFIYSAVLAGSFFYFRGGYRWMMEKSIPEQPQAV